jgi:diguanylate cyclase (GGDEF)-like protein
MRHATQTERRQARHAKLTLEYSYLFHVSPLVASFLVVALLSAVAMIEYITPREIWFGPFYLAIIALAAWALSSRLAIGIGFGILAIRLVLGGFTLYPFGATLLLPNILARVAGVLIVIGFISMARRACEKEWRFARTDPLTGAFNRQAFFEIVAGDQGNAGCCAIIFADLDGLKALNDDAGHEQGDKSLMHFARTIQGTIRKGDVFARMGGDEFVIFMKLKDEAAGQAVARRLDQAVNADAMEEPFRLRCSLGVLVLQLHL